MILTFEIYNILRVNMYRLSRGRGDISFIARGTICIGYHTRGEVISVLSLERRYHILSRVSAANEGQNMIS